MKLNLKNNGLRKSSTVEIPDDYFNRMSTTIPSLDKALSGGFVGGQVFTLSAAAGTGKTTLLLGVLAKMDKYKSAYISGEEPEVQLAYACKRLGIDVTVGNLKNIDEICEIIKSDGYKLVILDSLPSLTTTEPMNSEETEKYIATKIVDTAKETGCVIGCILHMTKDGKYRGASTLIHTVDSEFYLDKSTENPNLRIFRTEKTRFGASNVEAVFLMTSKGFDFDYSEAKVVEKKVVEDTALGAKLIAYMNQSYGNYINYNMFDQFDVPVKAVVDELVKMLIDGKLVRYGKGKSVKYRLWKK